MIKGHTTIRNDPRKTKRKNLKFTVLEENGWSISPCMLSKPVYILGLTDTDSHPMWVGGFGVRKYKEQKNNLFSCVSLCMHIHMDV